ncbi:MAG: DUF3857 domain-containing protein [Flavobacterium sp.]|nr:DUF3857 domain-containing protein [Flavobacterium sp.]
MRAILILLFAVSHISAQDFSIAAIPPALLENANAVVRSENVLVEISSRRSIAITTQRVVSVLNEYGMKHIQAIEGRNVRSIGATVYDANGKLLKKYKRKDFKVQSYSEGSFITDQVLTYLEFTPTSYPFTIVYESTTGDSNTAFIPSWRPVTMPFLSIEKADCTVNYHPALGFKFKEENFEGYSINREDGDNSVKYTATNIEAVKAEDYAPSVAATSPVVLFGLENFHLEGVDGDATSWESFSTWNYNNLLAGTDELTDETVAKIKSLVGVEKDPIAIARIIYQYVQDRTRYVSIQLGIGGWKPMKAKDVDRLGYGDCKALTNYTRALLKAVGVESYYSIVWADDRRDLTADFVSLQGNHVILAIPVGDSYVWLECTSQTIPFGFLGRFTDDRLVLPVKLAGGKLVRTSQYLGRDNSQMSTGTYSIDGDGGLLGNLEIRTKGVQYDTRLPLERKSATDQKQYYQKYFRFNNFELLASSLTNDKLKSEFVENVNLSAANYASRSGNRLMFAVNAFNQYSNVPVRYRSRKSAVEISRGFYDYDEITINIPPGFSIESAPQTIKVNDKFGEYQAEFVMVNSTQVLYKRSLLMNPGIYSSAEYDNFRKFSEDIARAENSKMVIVKN